MLLLQTRALGVTRAAPLFSDLDLAIARGDRIGLIAANGRGKSTLLGLLHGIGEPTTGEIIRSRGLVTGLVPQDLPEALQDVPLREAVLSALDPETADSEGWRADVALHDLAVPLELGDRPLGALSGGWQRAALLARAWVPEPDVLLFDEPTNHLDLRRIGHLQRWLATVARGIPCLVASHDRAFLDAVTTRTLFLRETASQVFTLPYTPARAALDEIDTADTRRHETELAKASQLRRQAAKLKNIGINSGSDLLTTKTKQLTDRADRIETAARPAHQERSSGKIRLTNAGTHAKALATLDNAVIRAPNRTLLFETGQRWIERGDRIVLLGANGTGKSRFIAAIIDAIEGKRPDLRIAPSAIAGLSRQDLSQVDEFTSPFHAVTQSSAVGDRSARALLAGAGIDIAIQDVPPDRLSGGQRSRLAMLLLRLERPNFYILDEPTNHLDIEGQEALEGELRAQGATSLIVSHDRSFVTAVGTRFWEIRDRRLRDVPGPDAFFTEQMGMS